MQVKRTARIRCRVNVSQRTTLRTGQLSRGHNTQLELVRRARLRHVTRLMRIRINNIRFRVDRINSQLGRFNLIDCHLNRQTVNVTRQITTANFKRALRRNFFINIRVRRITLSVPATSFFRRFKRSQRVTQRITYISKRHSRQLHRFNVGRHTFDRFKRRPNERIISTVRTTILGSVRHNAFA